MEEARTGEVFNGFIVKGKTNKKSSNGAYKWLVQCKCGKEIITQWGHLIRSNIKCECEEISLTGERFGRWSDKSNQGFNRRLSKNNSSGVVGVYWDSRLNTWVADITKEGKKFHIGYFSNFEDAVKARQEAEIKYYGFNPNRG